CSPSQIIRQSVLELKLQAEESFVLKVVQLEELLQVRHSVFVVGNAGCGKSQVVAKLSPRTWCLGRECWAFQHCVW
ncbi:DYH17 protein, partial [Centropus bengalensis]|nr:DYH17 protein [Centropus bengalensis]